MIGKKWKKTEEKNPKNKTKVKKKGLPVIIGALGIVPKIPEKRLSEQEFQRTIETIQTTALMKTPTLLR